MALYVMNEVSRAYLVVMLPQRKMVHVQVYGPGAVRIANDKATLETPLGALNQGLTIVSGDGIVSLEWQGPLWAIANTVGATINVEVA